MCDHHPFDALLHHHLIRGFIDGRRCLTCAELAAAQGAAVEAVEAGLRRMADGHTVVLHPDRPDPWVVHPFSGSPTHTYIAQGDVGWWAPCAWCGFGIAALVGGAVAMHARIGGETEPVAIAIEDGQPLRDDLVIHFARPPRVAWGNVHHYCAMLLPFAGEADIDAWSARHHLPRGAAVPITQAAALARAWYGGHADRDFRKWTPAQARAVFEGVGLTGPFWALPEGGERF